MTVEAVKAIWFECEKCGHGQFSDYTLEPGWELDRSVHRAVNVDHIDCEECGHENRVIEEI